MKDILKYVLESPEFKGKVLKDDGERKQLTIRFAGKRCINFSIEFCLISSTQKHTESLQKCYFGSYD